jgi:hypothetical protein
MRLDETGGDTTVKTGRCRFCNEEDTVGFNAPETQEEADQIVTNKCDCEDATRDRRKRSAQTRYDEMVEGIHLKRKLDENTRNDIAQGAIETLDKLFGDDAALYGKVKIDDETIGFLHNAAMLVYDGLIGSFSTAVAANVSVKITLKKGVLAIERAEAIKQKMEVA